MWPRWCGTVAWLVWPGWGGVVGVDGIIFEFPSIRRIDILWKSWLVALPQFCPKVQRRPAPSVLISPTATLCHAPRDLATRGMRARPCLVHRHYSLGHSGYLQWGKRGQVLQTGQLLSTSRPGGCCDGVYILHYCRQSL